MKLKTENPRALACIVHDLHRKWLRLDTWLQKLFRINRMELHFWVWWYAFWEAAWFHVLLSLPKLFLHFIQQLFVDFHFPVLPCLSLPCQKVIYMLSVKSGSFLFILLCGIWYPSGWGMWVKGTLPGDWDALGKWQCWIQTHQDGGAQRVQLSYSSDKSIGKYCCTEHDCNSLLQHLLVKVFNWHMLNSAVPVVEVWSKYTYQIWPLWGSKKALDPCDRSFVLQFLPPIVLLCSKSFWCQFTNSW